MWKGNFGRLFFITALCGFTAIHCAQDNPVGSPVPEITQGLQLVQLPQGLDMKKETPCHPLSQPYGVGKSS